MNLLLPLFSPALGAWGGLTRAIAVAHAAEAAGHRVAFCAAGSLAINLRERGYRVYSTPEPCPLGLPRPLGCPIAWFARRVITPAHRRRILGNVWSVLSFSGLASVKYLRRLMPAELAAARDFQPDAIFTDLDPCAFIVGASLGIPVATAYQQVMHRGARSDAWKRVNRALAPILAGCGLTPRTPDELLFGPEALKLVPSIPELDGAPTDRDDIQYVGSLLGAVQPGYPLQFTIEPDRRYVFCYMGEGSVPMSTLRRVLPQVFPSGSERLCVVGGSNIAEPERVANVIFCPYVSARDIMAQCDWTLCHGGQGTVIQSLSHGVPVIAFPGSIAERRFNAERVAAHGAGLLAELGDFTVEWLSAQLADRGLYLKGAAHLGERISSYDGARQAVTAIEQWAHRNTWRRLQNGEV